MNRRKTDRIPFPHPGETIREDFLKPLKMSVNKLALELRVPATRMTEIVHGRRGITADTALRLGRYSTPRRSSGSTFRHLTTWPWRQKPAHRKSSERSGRERRLDGVLACVFR
jgi:addiction module HigA family antidote